MAAARRQRVLDGPDSPALWTVIDDAVLRRPVGGAAVLRRQLDHLIESTDRPDVSVQILPYNSDPPASDTSPSSPSVHDGSTHSRPQWQAPYAEPGRHERRVRCTVFVQHSR